MLFLDTSDFKRAEKTASQMLSLSPSGTKPVACEWLIEGDLKNLAVVFLKMANGRHPYSDVADVIRVEASRN